MGHWGLARSIRMHSSVLRTDRHICCRKTTGRQTGGIIYRGHILVAASASAPDTRFVLNEDPQVAGHLPVVHSANGMWTETEFLFLLSPTDWAPVESSNSQASRQLACLLSSRVHMQPFSRASCPFQQRMRLMGFPVSQFSCRSVGFVWLAEPNQD
ncbi:hypothetical protein VTK56DRAFT_553 [Thermocarpiscus australiensis]